MFNLCNLIKEKFFAINKITSKLHILVYDFSTHFNLNFIRLANKIRSLLGMFNYSAMIAKLIQNGNGILW